MDLPGCSSSDRGGCRHTPTLVVGSVILCLCASSTKTANAAQPLVSPHSHTLTHTTYAATDKHTCTHTINISTHTGSHTLHTCKHTHKHTNTCRPTHTWENIYVCLLVFICHHLSTCSSISALSAAKMVDSRCGHLDGTGNDSLVEEPRAIVLTLDYDPVQNK